MDIKFISRTHPKLLGLQPRVSIVRWPKQNSFLRITTTQKFFYLCPICELSEFTNGKNLVFLQNLRQKLKKSIASDLIECNNQSTNSGDRAVLHACLTPLTKRQHFTKTTTTTFRLFFFLKRQRLLLS
jgi:hypothetical protein